MSDEKTVIRCAVACHNVVGEPDVFFVKVKASEFHVSEGMHYHAAKLAASEDYNEPMVAFDESDPAGQLLVDLMHDWDDVCIPETECFL